MTQANADSWHRQLLRRFHVFSEDEPAQVDILSCSLRTLFIVLFFACTFIIYIVLNLATLPLGVYAEPAWKLNARFRKLRLPGGIPVIGVATPLWLAVGAWQNWLTRGLGLTLAPFLITAGIGFGLLGLVVGFNKLRPLLPVVSFRGTEIETTHDR